MPWLREEGNSYVSSARVQGAENMKVADLMDSNGSSWNWGLIKGIFNAHDREAISKLSLLNREKEDKLIWKFNSKGSYTVKLAYKYAMETLVDKEEYRIPGEWTSMWKMKIPQKIKVFLWRALQGVLPTRMRLQDKGVPCTDSCPFCQTNYENDWHVFIRCEEAKSIWRTAGLWELIRDTLNNATSFTACIFSLLRRLTSDKSNDVAMMLWCLWRRRNDKVWDGDLKPINIAVQLARESLFQWQEVRSRPAALVQHQQQHIEAWQPPDEDFVKCNVDAAMFEAQRCFGIGMCIRNSRGHFLKAATCWHEGSPPPQEAKAIGLRYAISWLGRLGLSKVLIELDCKLVVDCIVDRNTNQAEFGSIISDCQALLQHPNFKISFARRHANVVAHTLAKASRLHASHQQFDLISSYIDSFEK